MSAKVKCWHCEELFEIEDDYFYCPPCDAAAQRFLDSKKIRLYRHALEKIHQHYVHAVREKSDTVAGLRVADQIVLDALQVKYKGQWILDHENKKTNPEGE